MNIALLIILIIYQTIVSILDKQDVKKYTNTTITEKHRLKFYKESIIYGWIPVLIILAFITFSPITLADIGFRTITFSNYTFLNITISIILGCFALALLYQTVMYFKSPSHRKKVELELNDKTNSVSQYDNIISQLLIPKSKTEKKWFLFVSLTAGICEEIVWRGCIVFLLSTIFPALPIIVAYAVSCVLFGLFHCYQGIYGIIKTSILAILFVLIYFVTNSIYPGIIIHFLFDYSSAFLIKDEN